MKLSVNNHLVYRLGLLLALLGVATAHLHIFLGVCLHNDVKVPCVPACERICTVNFYIRKCRPVECKSGCACKEGWVRNGSTSGKCILRRSCKRWVL